MATKKVTSKKLQAGKKKTMNKWLLLGGAAAVLIAGLVIVRFSGASACSYKACWGPYQFNEATTGSVVAKSNGTIFWDATKDKDSQIYIASSVKANSYYCVKFSSSTETPVEMRAVYNGNVTNRQTLSPGQCMYVSGVSGSGRKIYIYSKTYQLTGGDALVTSIYRK